MINDRFHPTAFISYCWESDYHSRWVENIAARLCGDGIDVTLDKWHLEPGDRLPFFMERLKDSDFVLFVCTPAYKQKSDRREGGSGYETDIITSRLLYNEDDHRKYIPLLRRGEWPQVAPVWAQGKFYLDFRGEPYMEESYRKLLETLFRIGNAAPAVGPPPIIQPRGRKRLNLANDLRIGGE